MISPKHIQIRIEQCLSLAKASNCPRRKLGALLLDPTRNVILADGYNGGPRGATENLCHGFFCERDGFHRDQAKIVALGIYQDDKIVSGTLVHYGEIKGVKTFMSGDKAEAWIDEMVEKYPPIKSGTMMERGCHHAEMNVICNAAAGGVPTAGSWMIILAEPCLMCAKIIHHAGVVKVIVVDGGYLGGKDGIDYLKKYGVQVQEVNGPKDPRFEMG